MQNKASPPSANVCAEPIFRQLFADWGQPIRNFLQYKLGNLGQAEDLAQEAFLRLWQACGKVAPGKAKSYLFTVANNLFLDEVKHRKVVFKFQQRNTVKMATEESPEYLLEVTEFEERLQQALAELPEKNRVVFLLNRIDKLTYQEIAERIGISKKAVEKRMSKALVELRELSKNI